MLTKLVMTVVGLDCDWASSRTTHVSPRMYVEGEGHGGRHDVANKEGSTDNGRGRDEVGK